MKKDQNPEQIEVSEKEETKQPKHKQMIHMMTFRVVPAYFKEIEKVADSKKMTVSKLIRTYIKEGMKRDGELTSREEKEFNI
jgi:predicted DNA-binding ribbon-helix-helix protein